MSTSNLPAKQTKPGALAEPAALRSIKAVLLANKSRIETALPKHVKADHMIRVVLNNVAGDPMLMACTAESVFKCVVEASTYGWEIGGVVAEAYMVPFRNNATQQYEATLIPGYRGLLNLARNSGTVQSLFRGVVRECDRFVYSMTAEPPIIWEPSISAKRKDSPIKCVFVMAKLINGGYQPLVMSYQEILDHRDQFSQSYRSADKKGTKDSTWHLHPEIMAEKTVIRQFLTRGHVAMSAEMRDLALRSDPYEDSNTIDGEIVGQLTGLPGADQPDPTGLPEPQYTDAEQDHGFISSVTEAFAKCKTVGDCTELDKSMHDECDSDDYVALWKRISEARKDEIRASRGTNSNKKS